MLLILSLGKFFIAIFPTDVQQVQPMKHFLWLLILNIRVSHRCWEHGGLCPPLERGAFKIWWVRGGWLMSIYGGACGVLKMLLKNTCEVIIYCAFSRNHFMEGCFVFQWEGGGVFSDVQASFLSGEGAPHEEHQFW